MKAQFLLLLPAILGLCSGSAPALSNDQCKGKYNISGMEWDCDDNCLTGCQAVLVQTRYNSMFRCDCSGSSENKCCDILYDPVKNIWRSIGDCSKPLCATESDLGCSTRYIDDWHVEAQCEPRE